MYILHKYPGLGLGANIEKAPDRPASRQIFCFGNVQICFFLVYSFTRDIFDSNQTNKNTPSRYDKIRFQLERSHILLIRIPLNKSLAFFFVYLYETPNSWIYISLYYNKILRLLYTHIRKYCLMQFYAFYYFFFLNCICLQSLKSVSYKEMKGGMTLKVMSEMRK